MRDATRDDLYALQQAAYALYSYTSEPAKPPLIIHKSCGGKVEFEIGHSHYLANHDRYVCKGEQRGFGKCPWSYRAEAVHNWTPDMIARALGVEPPPDHTIYKLDLKVAKSGEDGATHYRLRPASMEEVAHYEQGDADTWQTK